MQDLRKVQATNKRTLIISIPKRWGSAFPVSAGDHLQLDLQSDGTVIMRRHGASLAAPILDASGKNAHLILEQVVEPFFQGSPGIGIQGLGAWPSEEIATLHAGLRERYGAEISDETSDTLDAIFLGADRPEQLMLAGRRLIQLASDALRGTRVRDVDIERNRILAYRLALMSKKSRLADLAPGSIVLHLASVAAVANAIAPAEGPAPELVVEAFRESALNALSGKPVKTPPTAPGVRAALATASISAWQDA